MDRRNYWFNYRTGKYELTDAPPDFADYLPQTPAAQGLYKLYREAGDEPREAARRVLEALVNGKAG